METKKALLEQGPQPASRQEELLNSGLGSRQRLKPNEVIASIGLPGYRRAVLEGMFSRKFFLPAFQILVVIYRYSLDHEPARIYTEPLSNRDFCKMCGLKFQQVEDGLTQLTSSEVTEADSERKLHAATRYSIIPVEFWNRPKRKIPKELNATEREVQQLLRLLERNDPAMPDMIPKDASLASGLIAAQIGVAMEEITPGSQLPANGSSEAHSDVQLPANGSSEARSDVQLPANGSYRPFKEDSKGNDIKLQRGKAPSSELKWNGKLPDVLAELQSLFEAHDPGSWERKKTGYATEGQKYGQRFYNEDADKVERVKNALKEEIQLEAAGKRPQIKSVAAFTESELWKKFAPSDDPKGHNQKKRRK